ncbi:hypothetical protein B5F07_19575 [Lachnoclostridium sp. An169]|uniref:hypothetical protein n=1 Tax=Lachnoclostridium sp. An169 TaxID=1965569 RepID=UPI000B38C917|nr:hypothetical protein [Lachnoclostridium sp. An169]OUP80868.1 hypothetical protein B5F07_19575 [Lachnoclostridium sp. An169]
MSDLDEADEGVMTQTFINDMIYDMDLVNSMSYLLETRNCRKGNRRTGKIQNASSICDVEQQ